MGVKGYESTQGIPMRCPGCCPASTTGGYSSRASTWDPEDTKRPSNHSAILDLYAKEYKAWIACKAIHPKIVKNLNMFKTFWTAKITLANQTAIPASLHGYGMAAVNNNDTSFTLYGESIANFGAAYAATQEVVKSQGSTIASLQGQVNAMQQYCMALQQRPPPTNYAAQRQHGPNNCRGLLQHNRRYSRSGNGYQQPRQQPTNGMRAPLRPPTPYKRYENWHNCHTHGGDVYDSHTSTTCAKPGPMHNPQATHTNTMGGSTAEMHNTILPTTSGRAPLVACTQMQRPPFPAAWQQPMPPPTFTAMMVPIGMRSPMSACQPQQQMNYMGQQLTPPPVPAVMAPPPGLMVP
jgi:hypothetical protein